MKDYQKPEVEFINLIPEENITSDLDGDGAVGVGSNPFG